MAKLIPALILFFFCFSLFLSSSNAGSPIVSSEDEVTNLAPAIFSEEDVSDLKPLILLPTDNQLNSDAVTLVNGEKNLPEPVKFSGEFQEFVIPAKKSIDDGEKKPDWGPMNPHFDRMRAIRCRHRHPRFGGGAQIRPRKMPFWKEEHDVVRDDEIHHHHHHHHHGEMFDGPRFHEVDLARIPGVERDGRMIGEFKQPHFFFHHHHHHHHHHDDDDFHHGEEEEEMEHYRHRKGHGFWRKIRKFLGHF